MSKKDFATIEEAKKYYRDKYAEYAPMLLRDYGLELVTNLEHAKFGPLRDTITGEAYYQQYHTNAIDFTQFELDIFEIRRLYRQSKVRLDELCRMQNGHGYSAEYGEAPGVYFEQTWMFDHNGFIVEPTIEEPAEDGKMRRRWHTTYPGGVAATIHLNPFCTQFELLAYGYHKQDYCATWNADGITSGSINDDVTSKAALIALKNFQDTLFKSHSDDFLWRNVGQGWLNCLSSADNEIIKKIDVEKRSFDNSLER